MFRVGKGKTSIALHLLLYVFGDKIHWNYRLGSCLNFETGLDCTYCVIVCVGGTNYLGLD